MSGAIRGTAIAVLLLNALVMSVGHGTAAGSGSAPLDHAARSGPSTGAYALSFEFRKGLIAITRKGKSAGLAIKELGGVKASDVLYSASHIRHAGSTYTVTGRAPWTSFSFRLSLVPTVPGLLHLTLSLTLTKGPPIGTGASPDIQLLKAPASPLHEYAAATPVAGNAVFLGDSAMGTTILYFANYAALGPYFDRTKSGVSQPNFPYPGAGTAGSLVGANASNFGYEPPSGSLDNLPHKKATVAVDSYIYLVTGLPTNEVDQASTYLRMLSTVYTQVARPGIPSPDWTSIATAAARDLSDPANLVSLNGNEYLRSYVSDTRVAPELITQAGVLAGLKAFEAKQHADYPIDAILEGNLPTFFDETYHTVTNHVGHDPQARDESWYYIDNLLSLLQLSQLGDETARRLLLDSVGGAISLAHANNYEFPQSFQYGVWAAKDSPVQPDVCGGYAWLMLGMYDLTNNSGYLDEARASIGHVAGKGFGLAYELHMTAYTAAAAQRLYRMTNDMTYHGYAVLALANLFHAARLWDCTYGSCRKGSGYHTIMGLDPLPTGDYIAMLEQYESWIALRAYAQYDQGEPASVTTLVNDFLQYTPEIMQYALPPQIPNGVAATSPGLYDFVKQNNLSWQIPLEDLREGDVTSGTIGQEIYGAGGPFAFAAYG
jgi:hypothetical protein